MSELQINPEAKAELTRILDKDVSELTVDEIGFLRARRDYLKKSQLEEFDSVLNPKETKPAKKQTVKADDQTPETN